MGGGFLLRAGASMSLKSGIHAAWMLAFARMTSRPSRHALSCRTSRAKSPYSGGASRGRESGISAAGFPLSQE